MVLSSTRYVTQYLFSCHLAPENKSIDTSNSHFPNKIRVIRSSMHASTHNLQCI